MHILLNFGYSEIFYALGGIKSYTHSIRDQTDFYSASSSLSTAFEKEYSKTSLKVVQPAMTGDT